jgi:hypothetical protein
MLTTDIRTLHILFYVTQDPGWITSYDCVGGDIFGDDATCAYNSVFSNSDIAKNRRARANGGALPYYSWLYLPICLGLQTSGLRSGARVSVVRKRHSMPNKDVFLNDHALADKRVAGDLASLANNRVPLNLYECANLRVIANLASIQIDELGQAHIRA